jgi:4-amino-4-deoxy-L-arabinose transferase-like glycosyltransferase
MRSFALTLKNDTHQSRLVFWALLALAAVFRMLGLGKSIWLDEASTIQVILSPNFFQAVRSYDHPPLYLAFLRMWSSFGTSEIFLRIPSVLFGIATVGIIVKDLQGRSRLAALLAGVLSIVSPVLLSASQEIRDYALLALLTALSCYCAGKLVQSPGSKPAGIGLALSLTGAVSTHLVGVFLIPALAVYLVCFPATRRLKNLALFILPVVSFLMIYFFFIPPDVRARTSADWGEGKLSMGLVVFTAAYLAGYFSLLSPLPLVQPGDTINPSHPLSMVMFIAMVVIIAGLILGNWRTRFGQSQSYPSLLAALVYWGGLIGYSLFFVDILSERTALPGLIPFLGFAGLQLAAAGERGSKRRLVNILVLGLLCLGAAANWVSYTAWQPQEDWRSLCQKVAADWQPGDRLVVFPGYSQEPFTYYTPQIPANAMLLLPVDPASQTHSQQIKQDLQGQFEGSVLSDPKVFLVYRPDARAIRDSLNYSLSQSILATQFGQPLTDPLGIQSGRKIRAAAISKTLGVLCGLLRPTGDPALRYCARPWKKLPGRANSGT